MSYAEFEAATARTAAALRAARVQPGDRVALQVEKSIEAVVIYLATLRIGAVFLPLNAAYTPSEVQYFLDDAKPAIFIQDAQGFVAGARDLAPDPRIEPRAAGDLAAIIYTSGTTGRSKGAMLTHGALAANALALHEAWGFTPDDVLLHALPIFHVHGLFVALHCAFLSGCPMVWLNRFDEAAVLEGLADATVMMGVPTFYTRLLAHPGLTREATAHMRLFISGSAPLLESAFEAFQARTGHRILERYGMSEAVIITTNPLDGERKPGSVGFPLPGVDLRIGGGEETGVIEIRGPSVFSGYWRMPEKTAEEFTADGYFITGDVGRLDPEEVELLLDEQTGVRESAVVGVPHPDFGEGVVAVVEGQGDEAALIAALRSRLAGYKTPKRVVFVDALPRNAMGKIQKALLRQTYADLFR